MIRYECPKCGTAMESPGDSGIDEEQCPNCGEKVPIPKPYVGTTEDLFRWLCGFLWFLEAGLRAVAILAVIRMLWARGEQDDRLFDAFDQIRVSALAVFGWLVADGIARARRFAWAHKD